MKYADIVLAALIVGFLTAIAVLVALGVTTTVAVGLASLVSLAVIFHALFVNPPGEES